jgi:hypothetical protein
MLKQKAAFVDRITMGKAINDVIGINIIIQREPCKLKLERYIPPLKRQHFITEWHQRSYQSAS